MSFQAIDVSGNSVSSAAIVIKDATGTTVYSGNIDAQGRIPVQTLINTKYYWYYADGAWQRTDAVYTPHTITISKPGYQTKTMVLEMDRKREEVVVLENRREV